MPLQNAPMQHIIILRNFITNFPGIYFRAQCWLEDALIFKTPFSMFLCLQFLLQVLLDGVQWQNFKVLQFSIFQDYTLDTMMLSFFIYQPDYKHLQYGKPYFIPFVYIPTKGRF